MTKIVLAIDKPHFIYSINKSAKPNDEFTAGEWCAQAEMGSKTER
jgi:hypothetical protein